MIGSSARGGSGVALEGSARSGALSRRRARGTDSLAIAVLLL